jgi:hypothetical protein
MHFCPCPYLLVWWVVWCGCCRQSHYCCFVQSLCFTNRLACCYLGSLSIVTVHKVTKACVLCRCHVMMCAAILHQQACGKWATPPPPRGGLLLTSCCAFAACACFQVIACMLRRKTSLPVCSAWSDFPSSGGAPGLSLIMSCCIHVYLMSSSCTVSPQLACIRPCALQIITLYHCTNLLYPARISYYLHTQPSLINHIY